MATFSCEPYRSLIDAHMDKRISLTNSHIMDVATTQLASQYSPQMEKARLRSAGLLDTDTHKPTYTDNNRKLLSSTLSENSIPEHF